MKVKEALLQELAPRVGLQPGFMDEFEITQTKLSKAVGSGLNKKAKAAAMGRPWTFLAKHWRMIANYQAAVQPVYGREFVVTLGQHWKH